MWGDCRCRKFRTETLVIESMVVILTRNVLINYNYQNDLICLFSDSFPKKNHKISKKITRQRPQEDDEECSDKQLTGKNVERKEEVVKNKTDALWADFMKDVGAVKTKTTLSSESVSDKVSCVSLLIFKLHFRLICHCTKYVF